MSLRRITGRLSKGEGLALLLWVLAAVLVLWDGADGQSGQVARGGWLVGILAVIVAIRACTARTRRTHQHATRIIADELQHRP
jgi:uncharacterized membrane protein